jgi:hypothetical protein
MSSRRLTRYYAAQPSDKDYNIKTLVSWARQNAVQEALLEAADNLDDGNYDSIAVMQRAMRVGEDLSENDEDDVAALLAAEVAEPQHLIQGFLRRGQVMSLTGASKTHKSWTVLEIAVAVAAGAPVLKWKTNQAKVGDRSL